MKTKLIRLLVLLIALTTLIPVARAQTTAFTYHGGAPAPSPRSRHTAVWTGSELIVWGGTNQGEAVMGNGGRYFPGENAWMPLSAGPVSAGHSAVWTGSRMLLFGGSDGQLLQSRLWSYRPTPPLVLYQKP